VPDPSPTAAARASHDDRKGRRFHELDGLRALAICLVVVHHSLTGAASHALRSAGLTKVAELLGYVTRSGVELFFVLSGVVLLRPYLRGTRRLDTVAYLRRRAERLWPPFAVALLFAGIVVALPRVHPTWYSSEILPRLSIAGWAAQAGMVNLGWSSYNGAWWSLTPEVVFYVLAPLLVLGVVASRARGVTLALVAAVVVLASLVVAARFNPEVVASVPTSGDQTVMAVAPGVGHVAALFALYLPCFLMGAALALHGPSARTGYLLVGTGMLYCVVALFLQALNIHLGFALLWGGVVVVAMEGKGGLRRQLARDDTVWLGERSYSLFLVHFSVFYLVNYLVSLVVPHRTAVYFVVTRGAGIPLALLAAMALFWVVERRFARGLTTADRFWPRRSATSGSRRPSLDTTTA